MRKIKLDLDALAVDSFETAAVSAEHGTIFGNAPTNGNNLECASAVDACPSARGCTEIGDCVTQICVTYDLACDTIECDTVRIEYCPSAGFETCV